MISASQAGDKDACIRCGKTGSVKRHRVGKTRSGEELVLELCRDCLPVGQRRHRKRPDGRISTGACGTCLLEIMYRLRGGTADALAEEMVRVLVYDQGRGDFSVATENRDYFDLNDKVVLRLRKRVYLILRDFEYRQRLVRSRTLDTPGATGGRPLYYELTKRGAVLAGESLGIAGSSRDITDAYGRHGSGARDESRKEQGSLMKISHSDARNRMLRAFIDAAAHSEGHVEVDPREVWGESHPMFPIYAEHILDANGQPVVEPGRRRYAQCEPDGAFTARFASGLGCTYLIEYEARTRTKVCASKIDRYAAHALSEHERLTGRACAERIERISGELAGITETQKLLHGGPDRETFDRRVELVEALKEARELAKDPGTTFAGFPGSARVVLFILPTFERAHAMAGRLTEHGGMRRRERLQSLWPPSIDFDRLILFGGLDRILEGRGYEECFVDLRMRPMTLERAARYRTMFRRTKPADPYT